MRAFRWAGIASRIRMPAARTAVLGLLLALAGGLVALWSGAATLVVIVAAGAGAYIGALAGALRVAGKNRRRPARTAPEPAEAHPALRQAGVMLALPVSPEREALARRVLREAGGHDIERAQGRWQDGKWQDFDLLKPPRHVEAPSVAP